MKSKTFLIISLLTLIMSFQSAKSQEKKNFPFDPYNILKSWNYDSLVKTMGEGKEIVGHSHNQTYLAGLQYPAELLGIKGKLGFNFTKDSISYFQFRQEHETRVTSANTLKINDPSKRNESNVARQKLDSLQQVQRRDSISRDSVVRSISEILGSPISKGTTDVSQRNARYSAIWIDRGYSCMYKDYINYSEIIFTLSTVPLYIVGEFDIQANTEIIQKTVVNTKKMSWNASLMGSPSSASKMTFSKILLLLEFKSGKQYLTSMPEHPINYLPTLSFEDCDGDAIPEAWIQVPADSMGSQLRHHVFSVPFKEPNLIFNSDDQIPSVIRISDKSLIKISFPDGKVRDIQSPEPLTAGNQTIQIKPMGFKYLNTNQRNTDGSVNFTGGIEIRTSPESPCLGILEITYKHSTDGWELDQIKLLKNQ